MLSLKNSMVSNYYSVLECPYENIQMEIVNDNYVCPVCELKIKK